jgi:hypothetical protein
MKITVSKKHTTVAEFGRIAELAKKIRKNPVFLDDMKTCVQGIDVIGSKILFGVNAELIELELYGLTDISTQFTLKALLCGWTSHGEENPEFMARLNIYGEITDDGEYFKFDEVDETGAPTKFTARMFIEI